LVRKSCIKLKSQIARFFDEIEMDKGVGKC